MRDKFPLVLLVFVILLAAWVAPLTMVGGMILLALAVLTLVVAEMRAYLDRSRGFLPKRRLLQGGALVALAACILVGITSLFWAVQVLSPDPTNKKAQAEASLMAVVFLASGVWGIFYVAIFHDCRKMVSNTQTEGNHAHH